MHIDTARALIDEGLYELAKAELRAVSTGKSRVTVHGHKIFSSDIHNLRHAVNLMFNTDEAKALLLKAMNGGD